MKREQTKYVLVHCADTPPGMDVGVKEIREWHLERGFSDIGYHYVIRRNGDVESGRPLADIGAHCKASGRNHDSIGVCLVGGAGGEFDFTRRQLKALEDLIYELSFAYPGIQIAGHRDFETEKKCPGFDAHRWWYGDNHSS